MPPMPPMLFMHGVQRVLAFDVREGGKRYNARLPLGLAADVDRFLPRQIRQALEESEIEIGQLVELVHAMDPTMHRHPNTLIDIRDEENDDKRITINVE